MEAPRLRTSASTPTVPASTPRLNHVGKTSTQEPEEANEERPPSDALHL